MTVLTHKDRHVTLTSLCNDVACNSEVLFFFGSQRVLESLWLQKETLENIPMMLLFGSQK